MSSLHRHARRFNSKPDRLDSKVTGRGNISAGIDWGAVGPTIRLNLCWLWHLWVIYKPPSHGTHQLHATNSRSVPPHPACDEWNVDMYYRSGRDNLAPPKSDMKEGYADRFLEKVHEFCIHERTQENLCGKPSLWIACGVEWVRT